MAVAYVGPYGMRVAYKDLLTKLGDKNLRKVLKALTVTEKVRAGRSRMVARGQRKAYTLGAAPTGTALHKEGESTGSQASQLYLPRIKASALLRGRIISRIVDETPEVNSAGVAFAPREIPEDECVVTTEPYSYQTAAVNHLCDGPNAPLGDESFRNYGASAYLQMGAGLGKTLVGCGVISRIRRPTIIVVPTEAIGEQWLDEFAESMPGLKCAFYRNLSARSRQQAACATTHDVVICVINTFRTKTPDFMAGFGLIIFDEAHELHSPCNSAALWLAQGAHIRALGLSATPDENPSGLDKLVPLQLGPIIWQKDIPGFDAEDANFTGETWRVEYTGHPDHCETVTTPSGTMSAIMTIDAVNKDPHRLRMVAEYVDRLYRLHTTPAAARFGLHPTEPGRRHGIFVFAEHRDALPAIRAALLERFTERDIMVPELDDKKHNKKPVSDGSRSMSILRGGVEKGELKTTRDLGAHIVLTTYGFSRRGISLPDMTALVLYSPRRNGGTQINGRIRRRGTDQRIRRVVVDIVDVCTGLKSQSSDRNRVYKAMGYPIVTFKTSYEKYKIPPTGTTAVPISMSDADVDDVLSGLVEPVRPPADDFTLDDLMSSVADT